MSDTIIKAFLNASLFDIGEGTDKIEFLKAASATVAEQLRMAPVDVLHGTASLLSSSFLESDPLYQLCDEALQTQWAGYKNRFSNGVAQVLRSVLLQAIADVVEGDTHDFKGAVYYTGCAIADFVPARSEDKTVRSFLQSLANGIEEEAQISWSGSNEIEFKIAKTAVAATVDVKALSEALKNASGPAQGPNQNPHWPSSNTQEWMDHFGKFAADAIGAAIQSAAKDIGSKVLTQSRADADSAYKAAVDWFSKNTTATLRGDILYWKEGLYSPSRKKSYRDMSPVAAAYWAAVDLHKRISRFHPVSVEYFLREAIREATGAEAASKEYSLGEFFNAFSSQGETYAIEFDVSAGKRLNVLEALDATTTKKLAPIDAVAATPIPAATKIKLSELAVILFRDLQARRLIEVEA